MAGYRGDIQKRSRSRVKENTRPGQKYKKDKQLMLGKEQLSQGVDKCGGGWRRLDAKADTLFRGRTPQIVRPHPPSLLSPYAPETKWGEHAGKYAVVRVFRDDCLSVAGSPPRYFFHFWKAIGNCTNWKFKLETAYWTEGVRKSRYLDEKAKGGGGWWTLDNRVMSLWTTVY